MRVEPGSPMDWWGARPVLLGLLLGLMQLGSGAGEPNCKEQALREYKQRLALQTPGPNISAVNFQGCAAPGAKQFAFCDMSLSTDERTEDLLNRLTLDQKLGMISPNPTLGSTCQGWMWNGTSLGDEPFLRQVPTMIWLNEANTNVQSKCWTGWDGKDNKCSTNLGGPNSIASSWNRSVFYQKGLIISTEQRSLQLVGGQNHVGRAPMSVTGYGPNMNVQRDPRFGRNTELPSEDPFLTGAYAKGIVSAAVEEEQGVPRMLLYLKHFDAYGVNQTKPSEFARYNISVYDFWDSFLPAYRTGMEAGAYGAMCAHIAPNGQNSCSNRWLLDTLRSWGPRGQKAVVSTDCGEIGIMGFPLELAPDCAHATAWMLNNGTDIPLGSPACGNCQNVDCRDAPKCFVYHGFNYGNCTYKNDIPKAIDQGLTDENTVNTAVRRVLWNLFKAGVYNKVDGNMAWATLADGHAIGSQQHNDMNYDMALQGHILLKNDGILPLDTRKRTFITGPMSGGYQCQSGYETASEGCSTLSSSLQKAANWGNLTEASGCDIDCVPHWGHDGPVHGKQLCNDTSQLDQAVAQAAIAEQIIVAVGIDQSITGEGRDRTNITLPGQQPELVSRMLALGKPTLLVLVNGAPLGIEMFVNGASAIIESWQPGVAGMTALASLLLGRENRWGRLAVTMYKSTFVEEQALMQYSQTKYPGRTYKYYRNPGGVVFPFGAGMGYHNSSVVCSMKVQYEVQCQVSHLGGPAGDEVVEVFHVPPSGLTTDHPLPIKRLIDFDRVHLPVAVAPVIVVFNLTIDDFRLTDKSGGQTLYPGNHSLEIWLGHGSPANVSVVIELGDDSR